MATTDNILINDSNWTQVTLTTANTIIIPLYETTIEWSATNPPSGDGRGAVIPKDGIKVNYTVFVRNEQKVPYTIAVTKV